jgi:hypothetical protein
MSSYRLVKMLNPVSITVAGTFTPKGTYSGATDYAVGDQVDYNGTSYIMYSDAAAGTLPTDNTKWGVLASKGDTGATGATGSTGATGAKGDTGDTGAKGDQGIQGLKGDKGDTGDAGSNGTNGANGLPGSNGQGVPTGGTANQQLAKIDGSDYNTQWVNPVDISGKQDTLVSGTNIKTINSTSLLGSGDIVIGGAVDSVNTQTGAVVLDTDDIAEGTNKYVTSAEKTKLSNTSGVNTGDQDISGIATNASNITGKVSKAGDTMTGGLYFGAGSAQVVDSTGKNLRLGYPSNVGPTFELYSNDHATRGGEFTAIYGAGGVNLRYYNGSSWPVKFGLDGSGNTTISGVLNSNDLLSNTAMTYSVGSSSNYWLNTYTQKLYLNSTAYLDGSTAGQINLTGNLALSGARMTLAIYNDTDYSDGLSIYKSGSAGVLGGAVKDGGEVGYHSFYAFDGTSDKRVAFVLVGADGDTTPTTGGGRYDIYVRNSAGTEVLPLSLTGANAEYQVNPIARTSLTYNLGSTARYWLNTYTQKLYLNSTAYLDGSTAGTAKLTGKLDIPVTSSTDGQITQGGSKLLHTYTRGDGLFRNTFIGYNTGNTSITTSGATYLGTGNIGVGQESLLTLTTGFYNIAIGTRAGFSLTTGANNYMAGHTAGLNLTTGSNNFLMGRETGLALTTGSNNVGIGFNVLRAITTASNNTAVGQTAGYSTTGSANVFIGFAAGYNETGSNKLYIANSNTSTPLIGGDFSANTITTPASIEITDTTKGVILKDSSGGRWRVTVDTSGALTTTSI